MADALVVRESLTSFLPSVHTPSVDTLGLQSSPLDVGLRYAHTGPVAAKRRKPRDERKEESIRIRITTAEKEAWAKAAAADGRDVSGWLRHLANQAAARAPK